MKKNILPILFLAAIAIFFVAPNQKNIQVALGALSPMPSPSAISTPIGFLLDWSSDSYVPPGYRGKALAAANSNITIAAAPLANSAQDPEKLTYDWRINGKKMEQNSGAGKPVLNFKAAGQPGEKFDINCRISDAARNLIANKTISITLAAPQIVFYDRFSTDGGAIKNSVSAKPDQKLLFIAAPFFFRSNSSKDIEYNWRLDGQKLESSGDKDLNRLTLSIPAGDILTPFAKHLNLVIIDKTDPLQRASVNLEINIQP